MEILTENPWDAFHKSNNDKVDRYSSYRRDYVFNKMTKRRYFFKRRMMKYGKWLLLIESMPLTVGSILFAIIGSLLKTKILVLGVISFIIFFILLITFLITSLSYYEESFY